MAGIISMVGIISVAVQGAHVHNGGWKTLGRAHTINSTPCFVSLKES